MVVTANNLNNFLPYKSKKKLLKFAELYPTSPEVMLNVKKYHPGCVYYFILEPNNKNFESFEVPCIYISKENLEKDFPFIAGEIDLYISPNCKKDYALFSSLSTELPQAI